MIYKISMGNRRGRIASLRHRVKFLPSQSDVSALRLKAGTITISTMLSELQCRIWTTNKTILLHWCLLRIGFASLISQLPSQGSERRQIVWRLRTYRVQFFE